MSESTLSEDWRRDHWYHQTQAYLHDYRGYTQKPNLLEDLNDYLLRNKLEWAYRQGLSHYSQEVCVVSVAEPSTGEILEIGGTLPGDLFVDNFGLYLGAFFRTPVNGNSTLPGSLTDTGGTGRTMYVFNTAGGIIHVAGQSEGSNIQLGSGTTAPARADTKIQTALGTAPESGAFTTGAGNYTAGSGTTTISGSVTSGGTGTINEATLIWAVDDSVATVRNICLTHDATTSTPFTASKSITCQYSLSD